MSAPPKPDTASEDLNLWEIVSEQFDKAAPYTGVPRPLLNQIKVCDNVYEFSFPVRIGSASRFLKPAES